MNDTENSIGDSIIALLSIEDREERTRHWYSIKDKVKRVIRNTIIHHNETKRRYKKRGE